MTAGRPPSANVGDAAEVAVRSCDPSQSRVWPSGELKIALYMNAYHNWPGFFALGALLTEVAGFNSALSFASWAPLFFNLIDLGALLLILRACTTDRRLIWLSVWFFYLTNWVGQDYFSPQGLNFFFYLVIMAILLQWFKMEPTADGATPVPGPRE